MEIIMPPWQAIVAALIAAALFAGAIWCFLESYENDN